MCSLNVNCVRFDLLQGRPFVIRIGSRIFRWSGVNLIGGHWCVTRTYLSKNMCENQIIGSHLGGCSMAIPGSVNGDAMPTSDGREKIDQIHGGRVNHKLKVAVFSLLVYRLGVGKT